MKCLKVEVFCPTYSRKMITYAIYTNESDVESNGCEDYHPCVACEKCREKTKEIASERLSNPLNHPLFYQ